MKLACSLIACLALVAGCSSSGGRSPGTGSAARTADTSVATSSVSSAASSSAPSSSSPAAVALPLSASGLLAGPARPKLAAGAAGKVSVIEVGPLDKNSGGSTLPIVIRNNTSKGIAHVDVTGVAKSGGKIAATGMSQGTEPAQIEPGGAALGFIYFDSTAPPAGSSYSFSFESQEADKSSYNTASLKVTEANKTGGSITGSAVNNAGAKVTGPYAVGIYCFSAAGKLLTVNNGGFADQDNDQPPGATVTFTVDLYGTSCPRYLLGVSGYYA